MPSWNDEESSDDGSLLSGFTEGGDVSPRPPCPDSLFCSDWHGIDDSNLRCKHDMPLHKFVAFEGTDTGRKFLGCGYQEESLCDTVVWKDDEWPDRMQRCLLNLWSLYDGEKHSKLKDNVEYAEKNYRLVLENRDLEAKNVELHKQIGEMAQKATTHELELIKARKEMAEQQVSTLKEEKKNLEFYIADLVKAAEVEKNKGEQAVNSLKLENNLELYIEDLVKAAEVNKTKGEAEVNSLKLENKNLELYIEDLVKAAEVNKTKGEAKVSSLKLDKRKLEFYIADLLKAAEVNKTKLKKISEILEEE